MLKKRKVKCKMMQNTCVLPVKMKHTMKHQQIVFGAQGAQDAPGMRPGCAASARDVPSLRPFGTKDAPRLRPFGVQGAQHDTMHDTIYATIHDMIYDTIQDTIHDMI